MKATAVLDRHSERTSPDNTRLLLLLGPSAVGKTSVIRVLQRLNPRFQYISPYTSRPLRPGETDKISVSREILMSLEHAGVLLAVNEVFGYLYGTPREPIERAFADGALPLIDWPVNRLSILEQAFPRRLFRVYLEPPSIRILRHRLSDGRDLGGKRFAAAVAELTAIRRGEYDGSIDMRLIAQEGRVDRTAHLIYDHYLAETSEPRR